MTKTLGYLGWLFYQQDGCQPATRSEPLPLRGLSRALLAIALATPLATAEDTTRTTATELVTQTEQTAPGWSLSAPSPTYSDGVVDARSGFVLQTDDGWTILGDAMRWDMPIGDFFAMGRVTIAIPGGTSSVSSERLPGLRIEASRLGLHRPPAGSDGPKGALRGEAWDVKVYLSNATRTMRLSCDQLIFADNQIIMRGLDGDGGHGGILGIKAARLVIGLREQPAEDRVGFERSVADITFWHPRLSVIGIPIAYAPVLYRDYRLDYPWTRYEFGSSSRQGPWIRGWIGTDLPTIGGWHPRVLGRVDYYRDIGTALGTRGRWWHRDLGRGEVLFYEMSDERIRRSDEGNRLGLRNAHVFDAEQRLAWTGGAFYGRWADLPSADPELDYDERFRADFLEDDLNTRPLARRGASIAQSTPLLTASAFTDHRVQRNPHGTDIIGGAAFSIPTITLLGPAGASAGARVERLENEAELDTATRARWDGIAQLNYWLVSGIGLSFDAGMEGLIYDDATLTDTPVDDAERRVPFAEFELRTQMIGRFANGIVHRITPSIGYASRWNGRGDTLPTFRFDNDDQLIEDLRELLIGLDTDLANPDVFLRMRVGTRWAIRDQDLPADRSRPEDLWQRLRGVEAEVVMNPNPRFLTSIQGYWNGEWRSWSRFDGLMSWIAHEHIQLSADVTWTGRDETATVISADNDYAEWQFRPALMLIGNRYRTRTALVIDDNDDRTRPRKLDFTLYREMVDGTFSFGYQVERADDGDTLDHSFTAGFEIDTFSLR